MKAVIPVGGPTEAPPKVVNKSSDPNLHKSDLTIGSDNDAVVIHLNKDEPNSNGDKIDKQFTEPELQKIRYQNELKLSSVVPSVDSTFVEFMNSITEERQRLSQFLKVVSQTNDATLDVRAKKDIQTNYQIVA